jgi:hypothetical protein
MKPKYGPPDASGTPSGWPSPQAMSAPLRAPLAGGLSRASDRIDHADGQRAVGVRPIGERVDRSSSTPKKFGCGSPGQ